MTATDGENYGEFKLKAGETLTINNIPYNTSYSIPESVKLKNQISSKVSLQAKNKAKSSHSKCTQKVHENWKTPAFYAIIEVDKSGIGCGKNEL